MTKPKAKSSVSRPAATPYSSKIIKAGALISDTKTLLAHWHPSEAVAENTARLRRENVFGKSSRSRVEDIVAIFRQRYMDEPSVTSALARRALIPLENKRNFLEVSGDIVERVDPVFFSDPMTAAMKALGMT